ncbi:MAG TPA: hypothetical protein PK129_15015, partial [Cellvibrionaceae bacterium]|nr:hypothetical protein [Cellvibrionaceae bacterium]
EELSRALLIVGQLNTHTDQNHWRFALADGGQVSNAYWAVDNTQSETAGVTGAVGASLAQLKCPGAANDTKCLPGVTLYKAWDEEKNAQGIPYWIFNQNQLPALNLSGHVYSHQAELQPNFAPVLKLQFASQASAGDANNYFSIRALVTDANRLNVHQLKWDFGGLGVNKTLADGYTFIRPAPGKYKVSVTVTDSGVPSLSAHAELVVEFDERLNLIEEPATPVSTKPAEMTQAGAIHYYFLLPLVLAVVLRRLECKRC